MTRRIRPAQNSTYRDPRGWRLVVSAPIIVALLAGCISDPHPLVAHPMLAPDQLEIGVDLQKRETGNVSQSGIPDAWWTALGDATLNQIMRDAQLGAPSLQAAQARLAAARSDANLADAKRLPSLTGEADAVPTRYPASYTVPAPAAGHWQVDTQAFLNGSLDLDLNGQLRALARSARFRADQQEALAHAAAVDLQASLVTSYLQLGLQCRLLQIAEDALTDDTALFNLTARRERIGLDMHGATLRAGEPIPRAKAVIAGRQGDIARLRNRIATLVGRGPGYAEAIVPRPQLADGGLIVPAVLPANLIGRRPDVLAARYRVQSENAGIEAAHAAFYPDINLIAFAGMQSLGFRALFDGNSASYGAGPAISLPIFDAGRLVAKAHRQTALYNLAVADYNDTVVTALSQVSDALTGINEYAARQTFAQTALEHAQQAYALERHRYSEGVSGYLEVLLAQSRLFDDQANLAQVEAARQVEQVKLIAALGGPIPQ